MKLKIASRGTGSETVLMTEAGEVIENVIEIRWYVRAGGVVATTIELAGTQAAIVGDIGEYAIVDATAVGDTAERKILVRKEKP